MKKILLILLGFLVYFSCTRKEAINNTEKQPLIGSLDPGSWAGLVLVSPGREAVAFRFNTYSLQENQVHYISGKELDKKVSYFNNGDSIYHNVVEVGTKSRDNRYAGLKWKNKKDLWYLEWGKKNDHKVIGHIKSPGNGKKGVVVECYFPWDYDGEFVIEGKSVKNESNGFELLFDKQPEHYIFTRDSLLRREEVIKKIKEKHTRGDRGKFLYLFFHNQVEIKFSAALQSKVARKDFEYLLNLPVQKTKTMESRPVFKGLHPDIISAIVDNLHWMTSYIPHTDFRYIPAGRTWDWGGWAIFEWDAFLNSLLLSIHNQEFAYKNLLPIYHVAQYPNGNIPNYRCGDGGSQDHSQPPVGSFIVWKLYQKTGNKDILEASYEPLKKWFYWWREPVETGYPRRDGNDDGLFEWGADHHDTLGWEPDLKTSMYETGADDSPMWDNAKYQEERWTMNLNSLSLNCYMAMDAEHLANIAKELGKEKESVLFTNEYNRLKQLVNEKMWDENRGFYYGFYWNGEPNLQKGPGNFLPLLSGIASPGRAAAIVKKMNDTSLFWGEHVLPTISKDHPAFPDQQYWRGSIWPPSNYFAYQGLKRYQFDSLAHHFALKSTNMFMENYEKKGGACNENFDTRTGQGQGQKYQSWGPLFAMLMVEEFIDFEPWGGLRFGSFYTGPASLENLLLDGDKYSLKIDKGMEFSKNGVKIVQTDINAVVRNFVLNKKHLRCEVHAKEPGQFLFVPQNKKVKLKKGMNIVYFKR